MRWSASKCPVPCDPCSSRWSHRTTGRKCTNGNANPFFRLPSPEARPRGRPESYGDSNGSSTSKPFHRRWVILVLEFLGILVSYIDRGNLSIAAETMMRDLRLDPKSMGVLLSAFFWTYAICQYRQVCSTIASVSARSMPRRFSSGPLPRRASHQPQLAGYPYIPPGSWTRRIHWTGSKRGLHSSPLYVA